MTKESSESLLRQLAHASLLLCLSSWLFERTHLLHCVLPLPLIVVIIVIKHLNIVTDHQSHMHVIVTVFICARDIHSSLLIFSNCNC